MKETGKSLDLAKHNSSNGYRDAYKHWLILDLVSNNDSAGFIARKHGIPPGTLHRFKQLLLEKVGYLRILQQMKDASKSGNKEEDLAKENQQLRKALELAMLKVEAMEVLVDVAEDKFNIDIRKKQEPKQSK